MELDKNQKESVFVGEVVRAPTDCTLNEGMIVTSLRRSPVKAQHLTLPVDAVISIPMCVDTGEATALIATFVPAMGLLFHGAVGQSDRYSSTSLKGCDIMVTGGGSDEAGALVSLALLSGANRIFVLQSKISMATSHAESVRVELVSDDPAQWYPVIDRYMDLIVDLDYPKNFQALYGILKNTGRMVCRKPHKTGIFASLNQFCHELNLLQYPNASIYDFDQQIEDEHPKMVVSPENLKYI
jgi:NADPH:quinone reductase-like Zn-dependent oxidoreductase